MPPQAETASLDEPKKQIENENHPQKDNGKDEPRKNGITISSSDFKYVFKWYYVICLSYFHLAGLYGLFVLTSAKWQTLAFAVFTFVLATLGMGAGAHRLWSHRSYKARRPLQLFLMLAHSMASQESVTEWARDHRLHHKYSDTDADPYNASRGFFFSHIGWLLVRRHPEYHRLRHNSDVSDLLQNPIVEFQRRHEVWLIPLMAYVLPALLPLCWGEDLVVSHHVNVLRVAFSLNALFVVNSIGHSWGWRPYDAGLRAASSLPIMLATLGEGYHNFHHAFPQDYRSAEHPVDFLNWQTRFIDFCASIGQAYDRRSVSPEMVKARVERTGGDRSDNKIC